MKENMKPVGPAGKKAALGQLAGLLLAAFFCLAFIADGDMRHLADQKQLETGCLLLLMLLSALAVWTRRSWSPYLLAAVPFIAATVNWYAYDRLDGAHFLLAALCSSLVALASWPSLLKQDRNPAH